MARGTKPLRRVTALRKTFGGCMRLRTSTSTSGLARLLGWSATTARESRRSSAASQATVTPDAGEIAVDGESLGSGGPKRAAELGIEIVHQDLSLVMHGDVVQNLWPQS